MEAEGCLIRGHRAPSLPDPLPLQHQLLPRPGGVGSEHMESSQSRACWVGGFWELPTQFPTPHPWKGGRRWECQVCRTDGQEVKLRCLERLDRPKPGEGKEGKTDEA